MVPVPEQNVSEVTTTERTFVMRVVGGRVHRVNVRKGAVGGDLQRGDRIVTQATDEIRGGDRLTT
jgi:hypothetical protein